ncbi:MAG: DUF4162 domain-containing protein [Brockia lithotrophica]|nr:DUF4162 domain-containing protein [Brockia lithotrophica]
MGARSIFEVSSEGAAQAMLKGTLERGRVRAFNRLEPTLHEIFV